MAPVIQALRARGLDAPVLVTGQHRELLDQMLRAFDLQADWDLDLMRPNQDLAALTGHLIPGISGVLKAAKPAAVLAQGDTSTVFCAALAAYYEGIPFGHVEAGLRSGNLRSPFPEEGNRRLASVLAQWHFAPTERAKATLLHEGVSEAKIHVVGNTVIDALLETAKRSDLPWPDGVPMDPERRLVLVTLHRRENFGPPLACILEALRGYAHRHPDAILVFPVHPNPMVRGPVQEVLSGLANVHLVNPVPYPEMVHLLLRAFVVLTDSGGLQEEAPALGRPVLVFRDVTERPEAVAAGGVLLVGSDGRGFEEAIEGIWQGSAFYAAMAQPRFPYGDGTASEQIADILCPQVAVS